MGRKGGGAGIIITQRATLNINSGDLLNSLRTTPSAPMAPVTNAPDWKGVGG